MADRKTFAALILYFLWLALLVQAQDDQLQEGSAPYEGEITDTKITDIEVLRARGFHGDQFYIESDDGYILSIVRGRNPLFNYVRVDKAPILFVHGLLSVSKVWLVNSKGVRPKNLTALGPFESEQDLQRALANEPSSKSLPFLAMNFGCEIWLLSRRGFPKSEGKAGHLNRTLVQVLASAPATLPNPVSMMTNFSSVLPGLELTNLLPKELSLIFDVEQQKRTTTRALNNSAARSQRELFEHTFDPTYWQFTLDEQVQYDFPKALEFMLNKTGREQAAVVAHSAGGAITLMALSERPDYYKNRCEF